MLISLFLKMCECKRVRRIAIIFLSLLPLDDGVEEGEFYAIFLKNDSKTFTGGHQ